MHLLIFSVILSSAICDDIKFSKFKSFKPFKPFPGTEDAPSNQTQPAGNATESPPGDASSPGPVDGLNVTPPSSLSSSQNTVSVALTTAAALVQPTPTANANLPSESSGQNGSPVVLSTTQFPNELPTSVSGESSSSGPSKKSFMTAVPNGISATQPSTSVETASSLPTTPFLNRPQSSTNFNDVNGKKITSGTSVENSVMTAKTATRRRPTFPSATRRRHNSPNEPSDADEDYTERVNQRDRSRQRPHNDRTEDDDYQDEFSSGNYKGKRRNGNQRRRPSDYDYDTDKPREHQSFTTKTRPPPPPTEKAKHNLIGLNVLGLNIGLGL